MTIFYYNKQLSSLVKEIRRQGGILLNWSQWMAAAKLHLKQLSLQSQAETNLLGLDISAGHIKLLQVNTRVKPCRIEHFAIKKLPVDIIQKDEIKDYIAVSNAIQSLVQELNISSKNVALAIPKAMAILKIIHIDSAVTDEELEERAWIEMNKNFPDLVGEIYLDFFVSDNNDSNHQEVTIVACRKDQIQTWLEILKLANLQANIVDVDVYVLERMIRIINPPTDSAPVVGLLYLNSTLSSFVVAQNDKLTYANDHGWSALASTDTKLSRYFTCHR